MAGSIERPNPKILAQRHGLQASPSPTLEGIGQQRSPERRGGRSVRGKLWDFVENTRGSKLSYEEIARQKTRLVSEVLELSREERERFKLKVIGVGWTNGKPGLLSESDEPITAKLEVQFPDRNERTKTRVIDEYDGVLFGPLDPQERKRKVEAVIDGTREEKTHEYAARLARGIRLLSDSKRANVRGKEGIDPNEVDLRKLLFIDRYIRASLQLEERHPELGPTFYFEVYDGESSHVTLHMHAYEAWGYQATMLDTKLDSDLSSPPRNFPTSFFRKRFDIERRRNPRFPREASKDYNLTDFIHDPERIAALQRQQETISQTLAQRRQANAQPVLVQDAVTVVESGVATGPPSGEDFVPEVQAFPDDPSRVRHALGMSAEARAAAGVSITVVEPDSLSRRDRFSTYPVIMRGGSGDDQKEYVTSRQELARVGQGERAQEQGDIDLGAIDELIQTNATVQVEQAPDTFNRLLEEMQTIPQSAEHAAAFITRLHTSINIAVSQGRPCVYKSQNRGTYTEYTFGFLPVGQIGTEQQRRAAKPQRVTVGVQREWLQASAKSEEGDEQTAAREIFKRIGNGNFSSPLE